MKLGFVAVGPQRTGSTWIYENLRRHPELCLSPKVKESFFFDRHFDKGFEWYESLFPLSEPGSIYGEVGATYFSSATARQRIHAHNRHVQVLVTLREPIERFTSLLRHLRRIGDIPTLDSMELTLESYPDLLDSSRYYAHVTAWWDCFGRDQVMILHYDDLADDPEGYLQRVCHFLGVDARDVSPAVSAEVNTGFTPAIPWLYRWALRVVRRLRDADQHALVNTLRRMPFKRAMIGHEAGYQPLSSDDRMLLWKHLASDMADLDRAGLVPDQWRRRWADHGLE